jgi:hypothetical protein
MTIRPSPFMPLHRCFQHHESGAHGCGEPNFGQSACPQSLCFWGAAVAPHGDCFHFSSVRLEHEELLSTSCKAYAEIHGGSRNLSLHPMQDYQESGIAVDVNAATAVADTTSGHT